MLNWRHYVKYDHFCTFLNHVIMWRHDSRDLLPRRLLFCFERPETSKSAVLYLSLVKVLHYRPGDSHVSVINGSLRQKQPETQNQIKREADEETLLVPTTLKGVSRARPGGAAELHLRNITTVWRHFAPESHLILLKTNQETSLATRDQFPLKWTYSIQTHPERLPQEYEYTASFPLFPFRQLFSLLKTQLLKLIQLYSN